MSLPEAVRIALDNSEIVCVVYAPLPPATVTDEVGVIQRALPDYDPF